MTIIISATNRPNSTTYKVARYYQERLLEKGLECRLFPLTDLPDTLMVSDLYGNRSDAFTEIQAMIGEAQKFLFVIPEYNGSFPGVLKLFIDACDFPASFYEKKAALVGISSGKYGNIRGVDHFTGICNYMHLHVMALKIHIPSVRAELDASGKFFKEDTIQFTDEQMDKFIAF